MLLLELGIHPIGIARPRRRRTIVGDLRIALRSGRRIARPVGLVRLIYRVRWHVGRSVRLARLVRIARGARPIGVSLRRVRPDHRRVLRWSLSYQRRHFNVGTRDLCAFWLILPQLRGPRRSAAIGLHGLLLPGERCRRGRRRQLGHDRTAGHRCGRPHSRFTASTEDAALLRCYCRGQWSYWSRRHFSCIHTDHVVVDGLR